MKNVMPQEKEWWGKWVAMDDDWEVIDYDEDLKTLDERMKKWAIIPEVEGETIPLGLKKTYILHKVPKDGEYHGCGGHHYEYKTGGTLEW